MAFTDPHTQHDWLSRGFLREYSAGRPIAPGSPWRLEPDDPRWDRPSMAVVDRQLRDELIRLQRDLDRFLGWVEAASRTLAHLDVWQNVALGVSPSLRLSDAGRRSVDEWMIGTRGA